MENLGENTRQSRGVLAPLDEGIKNLQRADDSGAILALVVLFIIIIETDISEFFKSLIDEYNKIASSITWIGRCIDNLSEGEPLNLKEIASACDGELLRAILDTNSTHDFVLQAIDRASSITNSQVLNKFAIFSTLALKMGLIDEEDSSRIIASVLVHSHFDPNIDIDWESTLLSTIYDQPTMAHIASDTIRSAPSEAFFEHIFGYNHPDRNQEFLAQVFGGPLIVWAILLDAWELFNILLDRPDIDLSIQIAWYCGKDNNILFVAYPMSGYINHGGRYLMRLLEPQNLCKCALTIGCAEHMKYMCSIFDYFIINNNLEFFKAAIKNLDPIVAAELLTKNEYVNGKYTFIIPSSLMVLMQITNIWMLHLCFRNPYIREAFVGAFDKLVHTPYIGDTDECLQISIPFGYDYIELTVFSPMVLLLISQSGLIYDNPYEDSKKFCSENQALLVLYLFEECGFCFNEISYFDQNMNILTLACMLGMPKIVKFLVEKAPSLNFLKDTPDVRSPIEFMKDKLKEILHNGERDEFSTCLDIMVCAYKQHHRGVFIKFANFYIHQNIDAEKLKYKHRPIYSPHTPFSLFKPENLLHIFSFIEPEK